MAYATLARMQTIFGTVNIAKWADVNNNASASEITARINWAIAYADDELNDRLRDYRHGLPFSPVPNTIVDLASTLAGIALYKVPRQMVDDAEKATQISKIEKIIDKRIARILAGQDSLDSETTVANYPTVHND